MAEEESANFCGAVEDGTWKVGFNESQLGWAALIANGKPPGMDIGRFIAHILKGARSKHKVPSDEMMAFESVDYLKRLLVQQNARTIDAEGMTEKITIEMKREREGRMKAEQRAERAEEALRKASNRMEVDSDEHEEVRSVRHQKIQFGLPGDVADDYPDLEHANDLALLASSPATCYVLLRESRKLQGMLSNATISPALLQAAIMNTIGLVTAILDTTTHHPLNHSTKVQLRQTFQFASSTVTICLRALSHLCRDIPGRQPQYKGPVIYQLCTIFKRELEQNAKLCQKAADEAYQICRDHLPLAQRRVLSGLELHEVDVPYLASCRSEFLASLFLSKELAKTPRPTCFVELLEGLSAELYTKVGNLISETVFKESVAESNLPGRLSQIPVDGRADEVNALAVAIERDKILKMLRVVVNRLSTGATKDGVENGLSDHLAQLISTEKLLVRPGNHGHSFKIAKKRLQQTLCKAVFGEDDGDFAQALKGAPWDDEWGDLLAGGDKEVVVNDDGEEFVQGIWELVGWDFLEEI